MRLLKTNSNGDFSLTKFGPNNIPPYAILSHTWEVDNQELTFQEIMAGTGREKIGYRKIQFCGDQAKKDGLDYFWVDSCCIDKTSSAELSEAINSMFRWYQNADKCYTYLSDISAGDVISLASSSLPDNSPFRHSKWFTRGWTLQELLAPPSVEFFSNEGDFLGDKRTLGACVSEITGITIKALQETPMSHFSVDERMSWASTRKTTIEEDEAYCLLGIFEVHMPLIYGEGRKNAFRRLREVAKFSSKLEPFSIVPFALDPDFVDRPEIRAWTRNKCVGPGARAALVGLGGIGKSQIAIQYCHDVRRTSPEKFVFWVHASTRARFEGAYRDIADRLELPGRGNPGTDILQLVSNWLCKESNGQWTMVLDNVDDVETFFPKLSESSSVSFASYLPQSPNGSILITSRNKDVASRLVGGIKNIQEVTAMDESQGLQLLRNKLQDATKEEGAADLVHTLNHIPLAITQAAAFINRRGRMTASSYLEEFRKSDKTKESLLNWDSGDLRRDPNAANSVTTWRMSFEDIRERRRSAADLLSLMSFFNPQGIPEWILRSYSRNIAEAGDEDEINSAFEEDLDTLQAYSLITATADGGTYEMHALVQFNTRVWLSALSDSEQWDQKFIGLMATEFPEADFQNWAKCQQLLPHITWLYNSELSGDELVTEWAVVLNRAAWYMQLGLGKYDEAEKLKRRALEGTEKELGKRHTFTLLNVNNLALALNAQGKYNEAEEMSRRATEGIKKELGAHHPNTLMSMSNLAMVLQYQGKYDKAEKLNRQVLKGREKELGVQHLDTLTSVSNLALVLQYQGKYSDAEKLGRRALEGIESELGVQHPDTLTSVGNLALALRYQGKYSEAEKLNRRALEGREKELGIRHPNTLSSINNLADVLQNQGKYEEAEELNRRALEGNEIELGAQHPTTLKSMSNLAAVLQHRGKYEEAQKLNQRVLEMREKELGAQHPDTLTSLNNLAFLLWHQGEYKESEKLSRRALEGREKRLGVQHPDTLASVTGVGLALHFQGKYNEAEKLYRRGLEGREKKLGVQHPDTLMGASNLATVLLHQGKYDEAERLNRRVLKGTEEELGVDHPSTLASLINLALVLHSQGKHIEAEKLSRRALEGSEATLGGQHRTTLTSLNSLALALQHQGKYDEAEKLNLRVVEGMERDLGVQHPDTLTAVEHSAAVLQSQGKYNDAEKLSRRVVEGREKKLGAQHPDTVTSIQCLASLLHKQKRYVEASELYQRACEGHKRNLGSQHPTYIACLKSFTDMQQEAQKGEQIRNSTLINNHEGAHVEKSGIGAEPDLASSSKKSKRKSFYTRLKARIHGKES